MKIITYRPGVVVRVACPGCHAPARARAPRRWVSANGPRPAWSHRDGEPLCPVAGPDGCRPAPRPHVIIARRAPRPGRCERSCATVTHRVSTPRAVAGPVGVQPADDRSVYLVAGGDMVAVFGSADAADIMAATMLGANLEPVTTRLSPARWEQVRAVLRSHRPRITIVDVTARSAGMP